MGRKWVTYGAALLITCFSAFFVGRWNAAGAPSIAQAQIAKSLRGDERPFSAAVAQPEASAPENVRVAGFGAVNFPELYDLLQRVSVEQKQHWADEIAALRDGPDKRLAAIALYGTWMQFDAAAACQSLKTFGDPFLRVGTADPVIGSAPATALPVLAEMTLALGTHERRILLPEVLRQWSRVDPRGAAEFFARAPDLRDSDLASTLISEWAKDDIAAARVWVENSAASYSDSQVVRALVDTWMQSDLAAASEYVREHAAQGGFEAALSSVMSQLYRANPDHARDFVRSLPSAAQEIAVSAALTDSFAQPQKLAGAMNWALQFPRENWKGGIGTALNVWFVSDEESASNWIRHRSAADRDVLVSELCQTHAAPLSEPLVHLAFAIANDDQRRTAIRNLFVPWISGNPEALHDFLPALHLSPSQQRYVLESSGGAQ